MYCYLQTFVWYNGKLRRTWLKYKFRHDPVPDIHKISNHKYYRNPKTSQELKMYYAHCELVRIRGKRTPRGLPTSYDDLSRSDHVKYYKPNSWKMLKKRKQWM